MAESVADNKKYDLTRRRVYGGILIFVVAAGISLSAVPALRSRLFNRIYILKTAMTGEIQPNIAPIGETDIPYPEEFMRPASIAAASRQPVGPAEKRRVVSQSRGSSITPPVLLGAGDAGRIDETEEDDDDSPRFLQGEIEREAYEITLSANEKLASMTRDGDQETGFKTWGAAQRGGGVYWVRVIFRNASGDDIEYIWQTDISSGKTAPLNFNARNF